MRAHVSTLINIHHVADTRGFRVIWLCEELGLKYDVKPVDFSASYRSSAEWRKMNPVGKVPVMTIRDDNNPLDPQFKLFESGAMVQHILDRFGDGRLQPPHGTDKHGTFLQWCWFAEATFSRATGELANHKRAFSEAGLVEPVMEEMRSRARSCMSALDDELASHGEAFLLGEDFTAADIMMGYALQSFDRNVGAEEPFPPAAAAYWQRLQQRPAFEAAAVANKMRLALRGTCKVKFRL